MGFLEWGLVALAAAAGLGAAFWLRRSPAAPALWLVLVAAAVGCGLSLLETPNPPFTPGGQLGLGLVLGVGTWAVAVALGVQKQQSWPGVLLVMAPPALAMWLVPQGPGPILYGVMIAAALAWCLLGRFWSLTAPLAIAQFGFAAALGLAFEVAAPASVTGTLWRSGPLWFAGAGVLTVLAVSFVRALDRNGWLGSHILVSGILVAGSLAAWVVSGVSDWQPTLAVVAATTLVGFIASSGPRTGVALLAWVGTFALVFSGERGYGTALVALMLGLYSVAMACQQQESKEPQAIGPRLDAFVGGAALLTLAALFRLFAEAYPLRAPRADLYTHVTFLGLLIAVAVLVNLALRNDDEPGPLALPSSAIAGFWAAVAPLTLAAIWGVRSAVGWLGGSLAAVLVLFVLAGSSKVQLRHWQAILPLAFAGMALALPLVALVDPLSDAPRLTRIWVLLAIGGLAAASFALDWFMGRSRSSKAPTLGVAQPGE